MQAVLRVSLNLLKKPRDLLQRGNVPLRIKQILFVDRFYASRRTKCAGRISFDSIRENIRHITTTIDKSLEERTYDAADE